MKKLLVTLLVAGMAASASAQDNMEAFSHLSIGAEVGLHGLGVEVAMPIQRHLVVKAGYNFAPLGDLFKTNIKVDTKDLRDIQNDIHNKTGYQFNNLFNDESTVNAGVGFGLTNYKLMLNYYPFINSNFYLAGGLYYSASGEQSLITINGNTTDNDWAALKELNGYLEENGQPKKDIVLPFGDEYVIREKDGHGNMEADFTIDPLKYYLGLGLGRCIPNGRVGLQFEIGAMIYHNSVLYCQEKEVSLKTVADSFGGDVDEILNYVDKYPIYPQVTLRLSFRLF